MGEPHTFAAAFVRLLDAAALPWWVVRQYTKHVRIETQILNEKNNTKEEKEGGGGEGAVDVGGGKRRVLGRKGEGGVQSLDDDDS